MAREKNDKTQIPEGNRGTSILGVPRVALEQPVGKDEEREDACRRRINQNWKLRAFNHTRLSRPRFPVLFKLSCTFRADPAWVSSAVFTQLSFLDL